MADQDDLAILFGVVLAFLVDLGDQGTGGVDDRQATIFGFDLDFFGDSMGAENGHRAIRNIVDFLDEDGAFVTQGFDHPFVVNDFVSHIDWRPVKFQRAFDDFNGAFNAGAKSTRTGQPNV